jgi:hypothetical protein
LCSLQLRFQRSVRLCNILPHTPFSHCNRQIAGLGGMLIPVHDRDDESEVTQCCPPSTQTIAWFSGALHQRHVFIRWKETREWDRSNRRRSWECDTDNDGCDMCE